MLNIWLLRLISKMSAVLIGNLMAYLEVLLFIYTSNVRVDMIIIVYN